MEKRFKSFNVKSLGDGNEYQFKGYASTYGDEDRDGDVMVKGCFTETVNKLGRVPLCFNHDNDEVIGVLELTEDENGLYGKGKLNLNDDNAVKVYDLMKMGAIYSMSIGFMIKDYEVSDRVNEYGFKGYDIKQAEVVEVSLVTVPANPQALVTEVKSVKEERERQLKRRQEIIRLLED